MPKGHSLMPGIREAQAGFPILTSVVVELTVITMCVQLLLKHTPQQKCFILQTATSISESSNG